MPTNRVFKLSTAATTNSSNLKVGTGVVYSVAISQLGTTAGFTKLFDLAVAATLGTSVPAIVLPHGGAIGTVIYDFGPGGARFDNGISIATVTTAVDTGLTALAAANEIKIIVNYK